VPAPQIVFDIGMHEGWDAEFYLKKGFRVVAVEASRQFLDGVQGRLADAIADRRLVIVNKAVAAQSGGTITFFVRNDKDGWSSIHRGVAERDGVASTATEVETITVGDLIAEFGVPHFVKCDIEGADELVVEQIGREARKPRFLSVEAEPHGDKVIDLLAAAGYSRFQIVNQGHLRLFAPPRPAREGVYVAQRFHGKMSGLFGEELRADLWAGEREIRRRLALWQNLAAGRIDPVRKLLFKKYGKWTRRTWLIDTGWIDIHARLDA